ncbi:MAG: glycosyl hydrolase family 76 [Bacteroidetes bacterium]|nr:glycosyl hydrolase family 76 [Bacteroidota bacterium]
MMCEKTIHIRAVAASLLLLSLSSCLKQKDDAPPPTPGGGGGGGTVTYNWTSIADSAQGSLTYFWSGTGKYYLASNTSSDWAQYWPNAHALDVLTDSYIRNATPAIKQRMDDLLTGMRAKNGNTWLNYYYDDMEWMALACLRAYQVTNDTRYKGITDTLWTDIKNAWSTDLGGGLWWRKDNPSKNTPSNMPAAILAARLYALSGKADDLQWAKQIYDWQKQVLYDPGTGLVYDNIDKSGAKNTSWKFTYNQGTFIGAALELYKATSSSGYLNDALKAADYTLQSGQLTSGGILKNEGGGDGGLFKGVFVRYFTRLIIEGGLSSTVKGNYISFLKANAELLWSKGTNKTYVFFGGAWDSAPANSTDLTIQLSGIMLMEAMAELKGKNLL